MAVVMVVAMMVMMMIMVLMMMVVMMVIMIVTVTMIWWPYSRNHCPKGLKWYRKLPRLSSFTQDPDSSPISKKLKSQ